MIGNSWDNKLEIIWKSKVPAHDIHNYAAGSRNKVYGWEVADVKEYPRAVALEELGIKRAPQSWQYMR